MIYDWAEIGRRLRAYLKSNDLQQKVLAQRLRLSPSALNRAVHGRVGRPSEPLVVAMRSILGELPVLDAGIDATGTGAPEDRSPLPPDDPEADRLGARIVEQIKSAIRAAPWKRTQILAHAENQFELLDDLANGGFRLIPGGRSSTPPATQSGDADNSGARPEEGGPFAEMNADQLTAAIAKGITQGNKATQKKLDEIIRMLKRRGA